MPRIAELKRRHNIDRRFISWGASGWHICFDVLERLLAVEPIGRIIGAEAMKFGGWQRLSTRLSLHEMVLELSGYTILTASSGRQGLALLSSHHVDEVLLDYEMPQPSHHPFPAFHNPATLHPHGERKAVQVLGGRCSQLEP